jgi:hypothetical protein
VYVAKLPAFGAKDMWKTPTTPSPAQPGATVHGYTIENKWWRAHIDSLTGALSSVVLKDQNQNIVGRSAYEFNQYQYVPGIVPGDAKTTHVRDMQVTENGPLLTVVRLHCDGTGSHGIIIEYDFNNVSGRLTMIDSVDKIKNRVKEAVHFSFPFDIPGATMFADNGSVTYRPFSDTLAGGNRDFGYIGKWMDLSNDSWGVTLVSAETPIMEWGVMRNETIPVEYRNRGYYNPAWRYTFGPTQTLFSYAMNNYWRTNYKIDQEGWARFTYTLVPHGPRNLTASYQAGAEVLAPPVVMKGSHDVKTTPFLRLGNPSAVVDVLVPVSKASGGRAYWIQVFNPSDKTIETAVEAAGKGVYHSNVYQEKLESCAGQSLTLRPSERVDLLIIPLQR